jgi:hypothetical protein
MKLAFLPLILLLILSPRVEAVLANVPAEGIVFEATISEIRVAEGGWRDADAPRDQFQMVILKDVVCLSKEEQNALFKILRRLARFDILRPSSRTAQVIFTKQQLGKLKVGDRVLIADYQVIVASESDVVRLGVDNKITKK